MAKGALSPWAAWEGLRVSPPCPRNQDKSGLPFCSMSPLNGEDDDVTMVTEVSPQPHAVGPIIPTVQVREQGQR